MGGGVFQLVFASEVDLLSTVDFRSLSFNAIHGFGAYIANGTVDFAVRPEPVPDKGAPNALLVVLFVGSMAVRLRFRK